MAEATQPRTRRENVELVCDKPHFGCLQGGSGCGVLLRCSTEILDVPFDLRDLAIYFGVAALAAFSADAVGARRASASSISSARTCISVLTIVWRSVRAIAIPLHVQNLL